MLNRVQTDVFATVIVTEKNIVHPPFPEKI